MLDAAAAAFGIRADALTSLGEFENYVFRYERDGESRILRVTHDSHRSADQIAAELDWVNHLRSRDVDVCGAFASEKGELVETVGEGFGTFHVSSFEWAPGALPSRGDWEPRLFERLGRFVGNTHRHTVDYEPPPGRPRRWRWDEDKYVAGALDLVPGDQSDIRERHAAMMRSFRGLPTDRDSFGLCHTDLHQWNFHLHEERIVAFDTDDCAYHWFLEDISSVIYYGWSGPGMDDAGMTRDAYVRWLLPPFWRGYRSAFDLDPSWLEHLPLFLTGRAMTLYAVVHLKWDRAHRTPKQQEYIDQLRRRLNGDDPWAGIDFAGIARSA